MKTGSIANCDRCSKVLLWPESYRAGRCSKCRDNPDEATVSETSLDVLAAQLSAKWLHPSSARHGMEDIKAALRTVERETLERAAKAVEIASPSKNRNDLAEFIRLMGMSGETVSLDNNKLLSCGHEDGGCPECTEELLHKAAMRRGT